MMIPSSVLEAFEKAGYDVSMLRLKNCSTQPITSQSSAKRAIPCLADCLRRQNPEHPLLKEKGRRSPCAPPQLIEEGYKSFNLISFGGRVFALAQSLGPIDLLLVTDETVGAHQERGQCFIGDSSIALKEKIDGAAATDSSGACGLNESRVGSVDHEFNGAGHKPDCGTPCPLPTLIRENFHGFNVVEYNHWFYALAQSLGPFELATATSEELRKLQQSNHCLVERDYLDVLERVVQLPIRKRCP